jgi:hypothetical protein
MTVAGVITGLVPAAFVAMEDFSPRNPVRRIAALYGSGNAVVVLFAVDSLVRRGEPNYMPTAVALVLPVVAVSSTAPANVPLDSSSTRAPAQSVNPPEDLHLTSGSPAMDWPALARLGWTWTRRRSRRAVSAQALGRPRPALTNTGPTAYTEPGVRQSAPPCTKNTTAQTAPRSSVYRFPYLRWTARLLTPSTERWLPRTVLSDQPD